MDPTRRTRGIAKAGDQLPAFRFTGPQRYVPYAKEIAAYKRAKYQRYDFNKLNMAHPWVRCFILGLSEIEASCLNRPVPVNRKQILIVQRARLIARALGMPFKELRLAEYEQ